MKFSQQGQKESWGSAHTVWGASPRRRSWSRTSTCSTTWTNLLTLNFVYVYVDHDRALFNKHSKAWNKDALVGLNRSQHRFLVKISTKVVNEIQVVLTFSLPCTIAAPRRSYCRWSSWSCPQHNPLWLQTQTIMMVSMRRNCNFFSLKVAEVKSYWEIFGKEGIRKRCNLVKLFFPADQEKHLIQTKHTEYKA